MQTYISTSCTVQQHSIALNGRIVYLHPCAADDLDTFLAAAYRSLDIHYPKFFKMDALCKLAFIAAELLLPAAEVSRRFTGSEVAIVLANKSSSILTDLHHHEAIQDESKFFPSPAVFVYTLPNIMIGEISIRHHITGENTLFITEAFDSEATSQYARWLLATGVSKACLCGWIDANAESYEVFFYLLEAKEKTNSEVAALLEHTQSV